MTTPPVPVEEQCCSNCLAFGIGIDGTTICRAHPPRVVVDSAIGIAPTTVWPQVAATDWCCQWQAAPATSAEEPQPIEQEVSPAYAEVDADIEDEEPHAAPHKKKKKR